VETNDVLGRTYYALLQSPEGKRRPIDFDLSVIDELAEKKRDVLLRYLATNPAWKLYNHRFYGLTARRRVIRDGVWRDNDWMPLVFGCSCGQGSVRCEVRIEISLERKVGLAEFLGGYKNMTKECITKVEMGDKKCLNIGRIGKAWISVVGVKGKNVAIIIEEQQQFADSRFIAASVDYLRKEFLDLAAAKDWDAVMKLMPKLTVSKEGDSLNAYHSGIGTYQCHIRTNPGEEGFIYMRVADPETGKHYWRTESHPPKMKVISSEYIGWSENTNETFFASPTFTMYDGEYQNPKPVNVEVWFSPKSGGKDRKLIEQIFNLERWSR